MPPPCAGRGVEALGYFATPELRTEGISQKDLVALGTFLSPRALSSSTAAVGAAPLLPSPALQRVSPAPFLGWADWDLLSSGCGALLSILS